VEVELKDRRPDRPFMLKAYPFPCNVAPVVHVQCRRSLATVRMLSLRIGNLRCLESLLGHQAHSSAFILGEGRGIAHRRQYITVIRLALGQAKARAR
jgi:hypothetical protein